MSGKEKIEKILAELQIKAPTFASNIGIKYQRIFDIQSKKTKNISGDVAKAISLKYPQYDINWLISGEDEMIKTRGDVVVGDGNLSNTNLTGGNVEESTSECAKQTNSEYWLKEKIDSLIEDNGRNSKSIEKMVETADRNSRLLERMMDALLQKGFIQEDSLDLKKGVPYSNIKSKVELTGEYSPVGIL